MRITNVLSVAAASAALLAAVPVVAGEASASNEWRQVAYSCESGQPLTIDFRESGSAVRVTTADQPAVKLNLRPAKTGFRFGDSRYELRGEGEVVTWKIGSRTPIKCTSDDPAAAILASAATR
jgi:membrane-bound inhibitor of C-type lysozyme